MKLRGVLLFSFVFLTGETEAMNVNRRESSSSSGLEISVHGGTGERVSSEDSFLIDGIKQASAIQKIKEMPQEELKKLVEADGWNMYKKEELEQEAENEMQDTKDLFRVLDGKLAYSLPIFVRGLKRLRHQREKKAHRERLEYVKEIGNDIMTASTLMKPFKETKIRYDDSVKVGRKAFNERVDIMIKRGNDTTGVGSFVYREPGGLIDDYERDTGFRNTTRTKKPKGIARRFSRLEESLRTIQRDVIPKLKGLDEKLYCSRSLHRLKQMASYKRSLVNRLIVRIATARAMNVYFINILRRGDPDGALSYIQKRCKGNHELGFTDALQYLDADNWYKNIESIDNAIVNLLRLSKTEFRVFASNIKEVKVDIYSPEERTEQVLNFYNPFIKPYGELPEFNFLGGVIPEQEVRYRPMGKYEEAIACVLWWASFDTTERIWKKVIGMINRGEYLEIKILGIKLNSAHYKEVFKDLFPADPINNKTRDLTTEETRIRRYLAKKKAERLNVGVEAEEVVNNDSDTKSEEYSSDEKYFEDRDNPTDPNIVNTSPYMPIAEPPFIEFPVIENEDGLPVIVPPLPPLPVAPNRRAQSLGSLGTREDSTTSSSVSIVQQRGFVRRFSEVIFSTMANFNRVPSSVEEEVITPVITAVSEVESETESETEATGWGIRSYISNTIGKVSNKVNNIPTEVSKALLQPFKDKLNTAKEYCISARDNTEDIVVSGISLITIGSLIVKGGGQLNGNPLVALLQVGGQAVKTIALSGVGALATLECNKTLRAGGVVPFRAYPMGVPKENRKTTLDWIRSYIPVFPRGLVSLFYGVSIGGVLSFVYNAIVNIYLTDGYYNAPKIYIPNNNTFRPFYS